MKILHLIGGLDSGGAEIALRRTLAAAAPMGVQASVLSLSNVGAAGEAIRAAGFPVRGLGLSRRRPNPVELVRLARWVREERPDVLHAWMYHANLVAAALPRAALVWSIRCSNTAFRHYNPLGLVSFHLNALLSDRPNAILFNSEAGRRFHTERGFRRGRMLVLPNGIDTSLFKPDPEARARVRADLGAAPDAKLVGRIARQDPAKDARTFLRAAGRVAAAEPRAVFVLVGEGPPARGPRLLRLGHREDVPAVMAALDVCVSSSAFGEGFPNVVAEAMACGVPCVATDVGDSAEIVGDTGRIVPPRDPARMAAAVLELLADPADLGERARRRIQERFELSAVTARLVALYERLKRGGACAA